MAEIKGNCERNLRWWTFSICLFCQYFQLEQRNVHTYLEAVRLQGPGILIDYITHNIIVWLRWVWGVCCEQCTVQYSVQCTVQPVGAGPNIVSRAGQLWERRQAGSVSCASKHAPLLQRIAAVQLGNLTDSSSSTTPAWLAWWPAVTGVWGPPWPAWRTSARSTLLCPPQAPVPGPDIGTAWLHVYNKYIHCKSKSCHHV